MARAGGSKVYLCKEQVGREKERERIRRVWSWQVAVNLPPWVVYTVSSGGHHIVGHPSHGPVGPIHVTSEAR